MNKCNNCVWKDYCSIANGNLSNDCDKYYKKADIQTTTYVKIFRGDNIYRIEREINEYAEENNVDIISTSIAVRRFNYGVDYYDLSVVYRKKIKK